MKIPVGKESTIYKRLLREGLEWLAADGFIEVDEDILKHFRVQIDKSYPHLSEAETIAEALICCFTHSSQKKSNRERVQLVLPFSKWQIGTWAILLLLLVLALTVFSAKAHGQTTTIRGAVSGTTPANNATVTSVDANHKALDVNISAGGGTGGGPADAAPNAAASESDAARQKVSSTIRVLDTGQAAGSQLVTLPGDAASGAWVNCKAGCSAAGDTSTGSTALGAANATIVIALAGTQGSAFQLQSGGTGVYTVTPQCSFDGGTIYNANGYIQDPVTGAISLTAVIASAQATTDYPVMCPQGSSHARMKVTAYTSGTANWLARATVNTWPAIAWAVVTTNAPSYSTGTISPLSLDASGLLRVSLKDTPANTNKLLVTPDSVALPANQSVNAAQLAGTTTDTNSGNKSAGTLRVVIATDQPALTNKLLVTPDSVALPANQSVNVSQLAGSTVVPDPCQVNAKTYDSFSVTSSTQLISGTSAKKIYFCSWNDQSAAAENYAIVEGTGSVCATGIAKVLGLSGGTTAATGWNVPAGGGRAMGNGTGAIAQEGTNADNVCILLSGSTQVNGGYSYVVQ